MLRSFRKNKSVSSFLAFLMLFISMQPLANASIVSTQDIVSEQQSVINKAQLTQSLDRQEVRTILEAQGVDIDKAKERVSAMTDQEVLELSQKMDQLPAGSGLVDTVVLILVILLITDLVGVTDVYPFIN